MSHAYSCACHSRRAAFILRLTRYIKAPTAEAAVDTMAIQRFGLMPSIHDTFPDMTDSELDAVAGWIYDYYADAQLPAAGQRQMGRKPSQ